MIVPDPTSPGQAGAELTAADDAYGRPLAADDLEPWSETRDRICRTYLELLRRADSPLLHASGVVRQQLEAQLYAVIDTVAVQVDTGIESGATAFQRSPQSLSESIGRSRATAGIHPSQSLHAASLIFEAALPALARRLEAYGDPDPETAVAVLLNREILARMATAARGYVEFLLDKAHTSNRDERRRLSRELHDVAAPAVAVALQNLELFELYASSDPDRASSKIEAARQSLLDALATIRNLSAQSRESVAANGFVTAVERLFGSIPSNIQLDPRLDESLTYLPLSYAEELFLIIREALRNAIDHGAPRTIRVEITADEEEVIVLVTDDGVGFDVSAVTASSEHVGLDSMRERAALLDADVVIDSSVGGGTTVAVRAPLPLPRNQPVVDGDQ
jgi:signal transduction histidine kinase